MKRSQCTMLIAALPCRQWPGRPLQTIPWTRPAGAHHHVEKGL